MPSFTDSLEKALHKALTYANDRAQEYATLEHLLLALTDDEDAATAEGADAATAAAREKALVTAAVKKRKLHRQVTGTDVPWFPHDNDIELLKELCREAGRPRWVYFGAPAGVAGIHG